MRMEKLLQTYWIEMLFIGLLVVAIITGNKTVGISAAIVLALRLLRVTPALELLSAKGINWGIIVLTVGFLAPLALGKYSLEQVMVVLKSPAGWIAIACGALVAVFGRMGVAASSADIVVTLGVVLGTFIGVGVLKGSPVGPLIGSGMAVAAISLARMIFHF